MPKNKRDEVDIRVAQELKNNRDFVYETNQSLQNLSQGLISLSLQMEKLGAKFDAEKKDILISFENFCEKQMKFQKDVEKRLDDFDENICKALLTGDVEIERLEQEKADENDVLIFQKNVKDKFEKIEKTMEDNLAYHVSDSRKIMSKVEERILKSQNEMLLQIPELTPIIGDYCKKNDELKDTIKNQQIEIERLKKDVLYNKKKFEYLEIHIKRLKDGK